LHCRETCKNTLELVVLGWRLINLPLFSGSFRQISFLFLLPVSLPLCPVLMLFLGVHHVPFPLFETSVIFSGVRFPAFCKSSLAHR
jgi:hypothetical protein